MKIVYNGVELKILKTNIISRDNIYTPDGLTYLYTRYFIDAFFVINPAATTNSSIPELAGPVLTDLAIRQKLRTPRQSLKITREIEGQVFTYFSTGRGRCDAKGGPFPRLFTLQKINGVKTFIARWAIEAYSVELGMNPEQLISGPIVLSNRWTATEDVDENHFPIRVFQGQAVFNLETIYDFFNPRSGTDRTPDQFRGSLFPSTPNGWKRTAISVVQGSDAATVNYTVIDHWRPIRWPDLRAVNVTGWHTSNLSQQSRGEEYINFCLYNGPKAVLEGSGIMEEEQFDSKGNSLRGGLFKNGKGAGALNKFGPVGAIVGGGAALAGAALAAAKRILPQHHEHVHVEVWGDGDTQRKNLMALAVDIALGKLAFYFARLNFVPSQVYTISRDLVGKHVIVDLAIKQGTWDTVLNNMVPWILDETDVTEIVTSMTAGMFGKKISVLAATGTTGGDVLLSTDGSRPIYPSADGGTRGTPGDPAQLISLVTQILESPCSTVKGPPVNTFVSQNPDKVLA